MPTLTCAFTGHRPQKLPWKYDEAHPDCVRLKQLIFDEVLRLAASGVNVFLSGMAQGVDTWGALTVLEIKKQMPDLRLVCVLPCEDQAKGWSVQSRKMYWEILIKADEVVYVSREYTDSCMLNRDRYLVNRADFVLAVYNAKTRGGTAATVRYAKEKNRILIMIDPAAL